MAEVILVDEADREIGVMEKIEAHQRGLLHRAFSVFIINDRCEILLQKRASEKYHSPSLWTNTCCSHPSPGEKTADAAERRLIEEMGFNCPLNILGSFTYKAEFDNGLIEHEYDHVFIGTYNGKVVPNRDEVEDFSWVSVEELDYRLKENRQQFTVWFHLAYSLVRDQLKESHPVQC